MESVRSGVRPRSSSSSSIEAQKSCSGNILIKVDSSVGELSERSLSLELGSLLGVLSSGTQVSQALFVLYSLHVSNIVIIIVGSGRESRKPRRRRVYVFYFQRGRGISRAHVRIRQP
jgi:hypothetical protein